MQLASTGARATTRNKSSINFISTRSARNIHIPAYARSQAGQVSSHVASYSGTVQRVAARTRTLFGQFFAHLTAPGLKVPANSGGAFYARTIHGGTPGRIPTIHQRLSLPVRTSLSRPLGGHYFPRAPAVGPPCSITNMGLGTARNFSSSHSVFHNLVENVPIAGRAFFEADWEIKGRKGRTMKKENAKTHRKSAKGKEMLQAKPRAVLAPVAEKTAVASEEMDYYFSASAASNVTTCLLIPLAPTPTARTPLPEYPANHQSLLPHAELWDMHNNHELHSMRVSTLFSRLDVANVWERGVQCSAYAHSSGIDGVCTILRVEFPGWTKSEVRGVIGESGTGWCVLEETATVLDPDDDALSDTSSILSGISTPPYLSGMESPPLLTTSQSEDSFILPTLDFSAAFLEAASQAPSRGDRSEMVFDMFSDSSSDSWSELSEPPDNLTSGMRLGFSSNFLNRSAPFGEYAPREVMF